tara:strand:+ start:537 stop:797 length:261 start_codon:yes stop_codon:yes gene_type:complete
MNKVFDLIGLIGAIMIGISLIPQTIKTIKDEDKSISIPFVFITLISSILMIIFAIYYFIIPMLIANISVFINTLIILIVTLNKKSS